MSSRLPLSIFDPDLTLRELAGAAFDVGTVLDFQILPARSRVRVLAVPETFDETMARVGRFPVKTNRRRRSRGRWRSDR